MTMLCPILPFDPQETLTSYADRLSMFHIGRGMARLLRDNGINHEHFVSGRIDAVSQFAEATGLDVDILRRNSVRVLQRSAEFRGTMTSKSFLLTQAKRYCPACLLEDGGPTDWKFRLLWWFRHVHRCDLHGVWLEPTAKASANCLRVALNETPLTSASPAPYETPSYLSWLRDRVHGDQTEDASWLESQTLEQVLAASEMLGGVLQHGHKVKLSMLSPADLEEATDVGFSIYSEGPKAVSEALDTLRQTSPATAVQAGPLAYYGKLYDWLDRRCNMTDPGPIRDILRDHILRHSVIEPGTVLLDLEITERRAHTLETLSSAAGVERRRLARILKQLGQIPTDADEVQSGQMIFQAETILPLIDAFNTAIPMQEVPDYIGASKSQFMTLYRAGVLRPLIPKSSRGSVRNIVFGRADLDRFLERITALPVANSQTSESHHSIAYACQRGAGSFERLFSEIFTENIPAFRDPKKSGVQSILVDVQPLIALKTAA